MPTFDQTPELLSRLLQSQQGIADLPRFFFNRDLTGRVRIVAEEGASEAARRRFESLAEKLAAQLGRHAYPLEQAIVYEDQYDHFFDSPARLRLEGPDEAYLVDRVATEGSWAHISEESDGPPRIVFFSIKGGVGRSTALAATAVHLSKQNKTVLAVDLDLESPGLSASFIEDGKQPQYGVTDWLVEDLVDNQGEVESDMSASSDLAGGASVFFVPAHGKDPGEYISKLGRVWMPKNINGVVEPWHGRLNRMLSSLEKRHNPDVVLIDSRSGIDEIASTCVTELGARRVLLFSLHGTQSLAGYKILFQHWRRSEAITKIRKWLQMVAAMVPGIRSEEYLESLSEDAWSLFLDEVYDELDAPSEEQDDEDFFSFDKNEEAAPHKPWEIRRSESFAYIKSLHSRLSEVDSTQIKLVFGKFLAQLELALED